MFTWESSKFSSIAEQQSVRIAIKMWGWGLEKQVKKHENRPNVQIEPKVELQHSLKTELNLEITTENNKFIE